jgi:hypothetical protein
MAHIKNAPVPTEVVKKPITIPKPSPPTPQQMREHEAGWRKEQQRIEQDLKEKLKG